jgi:co-chaperonin GroES (HSP10)
VSRKEHINLTGGRSLQALGENYIVRVVFEYNSKLIELPETAKEYQRYHGSVHAIVESVGKDCVLTFNGKRLKKGDKIIFQRHEGYQFFVDGDELLRLPEKWVMAKLED